MLLKTDTIPYLQDGRLVIEQEADALRLLARSIDRNFEGAVQQIMATQGRVVVTGIGKSGHIGRKIAATLSATGSPAFFVHAAEAAHGDLGMIKDDDTLFILSNSGSTSELQAVIDFARAIGVPIIGVASRSESRLMRLSNFPLLLPPFPEACPAQMAPTCSTTMMLALGDALAIAAMRARGFSRDDLAQLHPGGSIGWRNLPVDSLLRDVSTLPLVTADAMMRDVVIEMTVVGKGVAGVVDDEGHLVGVISDGDLRRSIDRILIARAGDVMTRTPRTVPSGTLVEDAMLLMQEAKITAIFVMAANDPRKPVGLLNIHDIAMAY